MLSFLAPVSMQFKIIVFKYINKYSLCLDTIYTFKAIWSRDESSSTLLSSLWSYQIYFSLQSFSLNSISKHTTLINTQHSFKNLFLLHERLLNLSKFSLLNFQSINQSQKESYLSGIFRKPRQKVSSCVPCLSVLSRSLF